MTTSSRLSFAEWGENGGRTEGGGESSRGDRGLGTWPGGTVGRGCRRRRPGESENWRSPCARSAVMVWGGPVNASGSETRHHHHHRTGVPSEAQRWTASRPSMVTTSPEGVTIICSVLSNTNNNERGTTRQRVDRALLITSWRGGHGTAGDVLGLG
jgi:hypothetical protein